MHPPPKPQPGDFLRPVRWLLGRELLGKLKSIALYAAFGDKLDHKDWMRGEPLAIEPRPSSGSADPALASRDDELWFDYIADTGDGQLATYNVAYLCLADLHARGPAAPGAALGFTPTGAPALALPRGAFLLVGGDTAYHVADFPTLAERFWGPFMWAHDERAREEQAQGRTLARRPLFGLPGNHDYYDSLHGFNQQFRRPVGAGPRLEIPAFERRQEASYLALTLPFDWRLWALDTQGGRLDFRQREFFTGLLAQGAPPERLIMVSPEPAVVFGAAVDKDFAESLTALSVERPFLDDGKLARGVRLDSRATSTTTPATGARRPRARPRTPRTRTTTRRWWPAPAARSSTPRTPATARSRPSGSTPARASRAGRSRAACSIRAPSSMAATSGSSAP